jgi:CRP/FNR family transcriptional regulator
LHDSPSGKEVSRVKLQRLKLSELVAQDPELMRSELVVHLPPAAVATVLDAAQLRRFEAGTLIFREGSPGSTLFFILKGEVQLSCENAEVVACARGDVFGEVEVLRPGPRSLTAHALSDLDVAELPRQALTLLGEAAKPLGLRLLSIAQARLGARSELDAFLKRW